MDTKINTKINTKIKAMIPLGTLLNLKIPTDFVSSFDVPTISGILGWTDTNNGTAEYEVYSSTNGGAATLLATTESGATSYADTTCKQNATVVYSIKAKKGTKVSDAVLATSLATPLCWKSNQSTLTPHVINELRITAGKSVTVNYSDGTSQAYIGNNSNITKNFAATGQYNVWLSGDTSFITHFNCTTQPNYGDVSNWIVNNFNDFRISTSAFSGSLSTWTLSNQLVSFRIDVNSSISGEVNWNIPSTCSLSWAGATNISSVLPTITNHVSNGLSYQFQNCNFSSSNFTEFRLGMTAFNIGSQKVTFSTSEIDKLLKTLADWYQVNAPTANCTFTMNGANMGIPTGGASNVDLVRLVGYYTAAGRTATVIVRTS